MKLNEGMEAALEILSLLMEQMAGAVQQIQSKVEEKESKQAKELTSKQASKQANSKRNRKFIG